LALNWFVQFPFTFKDLCPDFFRFLKCRARRPCHFPFAFGPSENCSLVTAEVRETCNELTEKIAGPVARLKPSRWFGDVLCDMTMFHMDKLQKQLILMRQGLSLLLRPTSIRTEIRLTFCSIILGASKKRNSCAPLAECSLFRHRIAAAVGRSGASQRSKETAQRRRSSPLLAVTNVSPVHAQTVETGKREILLQADSSWKGKPYTIPRGPPSIDHAESEQGREKLTSSRQSPAGIQRTTRKLRLRGEVSVPSPETWIDLPSI
jgi:hypothetical protein